MQELKIDTGVEEFRVNGRGVLRFNPPDQNLYPRFFAAGNTLQQYDAEPTAATEKSAGRWTKPSICGHCGSVLTVQPLMI